jgi:hypothetical protein
MQRPNVEDEAAGDKDDDRDEKCSGANDDENARTDRRW